jgi:hypothetical protein
LLFKNKFGEGYTLLARISSPSDGLQPNIQPLMKFIEEKFPNGETKDIQIILAFNLIWKTNKNN